MINEGDARWQKRQKSSKGTTKADYGIGNWFMADADDIGAHVQRACRDLAFTGLGVQVRNFRNAVLYGGYNNMAGSRFSASVIPPSGPLSAVSSTQGRTGPQYNVVQAVIDTIMSRILANGEPHVTFLTNKGDFELQHKAELLEQYCEGLMNQVNFAKQSIRVLLDCLVFGTGFMKINSDANDNIVCERVFPNEIWAEAWDAREQKPRSIYQVGTVDRNVLAAQYPKFAKEIMAIQAVHPLDLSTATALSSNQIPYWEAWHLKSPGEGKDDSRHVKAISEDVVLIDEKWDRDFPFVLLRFTDGIEGFFGQGVAERLWGHQNALNSITRVEYVAHSQMSLPRIYLRTDSKINENKVMSSRSGLVLTGSGPAPEVLNWPATSPNFTEWKEWVISSAYEFIGVSQLSASGVKPTGLNSGAAIRDYMDVADVRFTLLQQRFGHFYVSGAERLVAQAVELYSKNKKMPIKVKGKKFIETIDWKQIDLGEDEYSIDLYETSSLPRTPSGKLSMVQELMQASLISPDEGRRLLQFPDLDEALSLDNAAQVNAEMTSYKLLHEEEFPTPDPLQNIQLCIQEVTKAALRAMNNDAPVEKVQRCREWLAQANALITPPPPPVPTGPANINTGAPGAPPPGPQAAPAPPPQSDLLPNGANQ
jgi:hypothetical protein